MPKFNQESFSKLSTCHMDLQVLFFEVVRSYDCSILEGYRNQEDQDKYFEEGRTKLKYPNGKHNSNPSNAVDAAPFPIDWHNKRAFDHFAGYVLATAEQLRQQGKITHSVRWGGDWNRDNQIGDQSFDDLVHFELVP